MGIGIVLIFWFVVGCVVAGIGVLVLGAGTALSTRGVARGRRPAIVFACLLPFLCFGWAGGIFVVQSLVSMVFLDRDPGVGDGWSTPIPNGYRIEMIDVTDHGWLCHQKDSGRSLGGCVEGVRRIQVTGGRILGAKDSGWFQRLGDDGTPVDGYFSIDTNTGKWTDFKSEEALSAHARQNGIAINLVAIKDVYYTYRGTWFDHLMVLVAIGPAIIGLALLVWWVLRLRRSGDAEPAAANLC